jgi:hypothetical protein
VGVHAVSEKPYELAYEASIRAIDNQAATVESLRSRAGTILAATALVTSFFGGQALTRGVSSPLHVVSFTTAALGSFIAVSLLSLTILLPFRLRFSLRARAILSFFEEEAEDGPVGAAETLREVALQYESMHEFNARQIRVLVVCFRLAIPCLVGEVGFWLTVLARGGL